VTWRVPGFEAFCTLATDIRLRPYLAIPSDVWDSSHRAVLDRLLKLSIG
jgi:hypothetical protein